MHVRLTTALGMEVADEETGRQVFGYLDGIVLRPDTARVEGFFIRTRRLLPSRLLYLSVMDIRRWGAAVSVSGVDALSPLEDNVRVVSLLEEERPLLGQRIYTESGKHLGTCADVQFNTVHFMTEWIFPKTLLSWGTPLPVRQILEVRKDRIVVRDTAVPDPEPAGTVPLIETMPEAI
jgi:sporulation protein YlmC with PRC-barrel domain